MGGGQRRRAQNNGCRSQRETESLPAWAGQEAVSLGWTGRTDRRTERKQQLEDEKSEKRVCQDALLGAGVQRTSRSKSYTHAWRHSMERDRGYKAPQCPRRQIQSKALLINFYECVTEAQVVCLFNKTLMCQKTKELSDMEYKHGGE